MMLMGVDVNGLGVYKLAVSAAWSYASWMMTSERSLWIVLGGCLYEYKSFGTHLLIIVRLVRQSSNLETGG